MWIYLYIYMCTCMCVTHDYAIDYLGRNAKTTLHLALSFELVKLGRKNGKKVSEAITALLL